jgi:hypothetical protein
MKKKNEKRISSLRKKTDNFFSKVAPKPIKAYHCKTNRTLDIK